MKEGIVKKLISGAAACVMCLTAIPSEPDTLAAADRCDQGQQDGYDWELWNQYDQGTANMQLLGNGTFSCEWSGIENVLFRTGKKWTSNSPQWDTLDGITMDYAADYQPNGNSYLSVYGWTKSPLVEYYIIESWGTWRPPGGTGYKDTITVDGVEYDVYQTTRVQQPSIEGTQTFPQYFSVRKEGDKSTSGTVDIAKHFAAWENLGLDMGGLYEVSLVVEGYQSSGKATVTKNDITIGGGFDNSETTTPTDPVEPEAPSDGTYYFNDTFESGNGDWESRGGSTLTTDSENYYGGGNSLYVSGRTDTWNGAAISLDSAQFVPGYTYSFSTGFLQTNGATEEAKLTLQYTDSSGTEQYATVATADAESGVWTKLENTAYTIPEGASNLLLYVESDTTNDFYIDNAIGAVEGTKSDVTTGGGTVKGSSSSVTEPSVDVIPGDVNSDGIINSYDISLARKGLVSGFDSTTAKTAADVNGNGTYEVADLILIQQFILGRITEFPKDEGSSDDSRSGSDVSPTLFMETVRANMAETEPSSVTAQNGGTDYGTIESRTYYSTNAARNKKVNVLLPAGYNENEKYPVLYVLHGIFGNQDSMLDDSMKIQTMLGNLIASGEAEKMIIVFPHMYTSKTQEDCTGFTVENTIAYDNFLYDIADDLMPFIEQNYSVKTGRDNTAITGFSMGGREAIYIGMSRPDLFGYIGGCCPAPGITPTVDSFMTHPGCMQESEMKFDSNNPLPYMFMISAAVRDDVVGSNPENYHNILTTNGVDHIWQQIAAGDHGGNSVRPHMYNYLRYVFQAD